MKLTTIRFQTPNSQADYDLDVDMSDTQPPAPQVHSHLHPQDLVPNQLASRSEGCAKYETPGEMLNSGTVCYISQIIIRRNMRKSLQFAF